MIFFVKNNQSDWVSGFEWKEKKKLARSSLCVEKVTKELDVNMAFITNEASYSSQLSLRPYGRLSHEGRELIH